MSTTPSAHTDPHSATAKREPLRPVEPVLIRAQQALAASEYAELRQLDCEFFAGVLTLRGTVSSFYMKQLAQESLRGLDDVHCIANQVRVADRRQ
ncbi:BON domain-containing protein [Roseimaritima ulvae]|uniref:BON domain protein n=1 Tax=Roseimaritima ulvae TaxID=980254 RepID=A0A5B9R306_9BACT|nr:BON domain-containing protein [Roseimaritima ulvae]QEG43846.1 BON domain protein [Roseimaritima ulvae]